MADFENGQGISADAPGSSPKGILPDGQRKAFDSLLATEKVLNEQFLEACVRVALQEEVRSILGKDKGQ